MIWLHASQISGFLAAQVTNALLIYLIIKKAGKLFGAYRHVMCVFAIYSIIYAWIEVLAQPIIHIVGPVFIVLTDGPLKSFGQISNDIACLYCGSFALVISLLASQFFYRYIAMCRTEMLSNIEGFKLTFIFIPSLVCFIAWFEFVYWGMANTLEKQLYIKEEILKIYGEDSTRVGFIAPMYWSVGKNGEKIWNIGDLMASVGCFFIIAICFSTIVFCASKIYLRMKSASAHMSAKTLELNRQLFITLTLQTALPFIMMYSPVGLLLTLPLFEVHVGWVANFVAASAAIYPALEPLIAMFCIKDFRKFILCNRKNTVGSTHYHKTPSNTAL